MSQPNSNDEVIRVVYQAVADYSQMLRETRKAQAETRKLKADIDGLAGTTTARVKVTADTAQARTELGRVLRDVMVKVKVTVDAAAANAELTRLLRDVTVKARVVVDSLAARAEIARTLAALRDLSVKVRVQTDGAALSTLATQLARIRDLSVRVSVMVDDGALARLRAALAALRNLVVKVDVQVDAAALARLSARLARVRAKVTVELDDAGTLAAFRALITRMQAIAKVTIRVDVDSSVIRRLSTMIGQLERMRDRLATAPGPASAPVPGSPRRAGGRGASGGGDKSPIPEGLSSAAGLVIKFLPLIATAIPVVAGLAVAIGGIAAGLLAAGGAFGIFAVTAVGAIAKVTAAVKAYEKSGTITESGPLRGVVDKFEALKARYTQLQKATEQPVFAVFTRGLQIALTLLDRVQPLINRVTGGIDAALAKVQDALSGRGFSDFLNFAAQQGPAAINDFTTALLGITGGLGRLLMAFSPFIRTFLTGFADAGTAFNTWASGLSSNTSFQKFLDYAAEQLPKIIDLIKALFTAGANIAAALAPVGSLLLSIATGAAKFIAFLPPALLAGIAGAIFGVAVAIKALQVVIAVGAAIKKFSELLALLPGRFGAAAAAAGVLRIAALSLAALTVIGAVVAAIGIGISLLSARNEKAAKSADLHRTAVERLTAALQQYGTEETAQKRQDAYNDANAKPIEVGTLDKGITNLGQDIVTKTAAGYAKQAGVDVGTITDAALGKQPAIDTTVSKLQALRDDLLKQRDEASRSYNIPLADNLEAQAAAVDGSITQFKSYKGAAEDAATAAADLDTAAGGATGGITGTGDAAEGAATKLDKLKAALSADFASDLDTAKVTGAISAMDAYTDAVQANKDAIAAAARADRDAKAAIEAVNEARLAAVQRIKDVQRALRDGALDERQAKLSNKEAQQKLADVIANGGTDNEIEQARIDAERAANTLSDLEQDKKPKTDALEKELAAGVEGNKALLAAIQAQKDAQSALTAANTNMAKAAAALTNLHTAFDVAAGSLGLTEEGVQKLKDKMDTLKNRTIKIIGDTSDLEAKIKAALQGQYALQLLAAHPDWSLERATAEAISLVNNTTGDGGIRLAPGAGQSRDKPERAEGGPLLASPATAGPVWGPGTGTSDSILADLPAGGPVRLSRGEHIVTDAEVQAAPGGHGYLEAFRAGLRAGRPWAPRGYATGGALLGPATLSSGFAMDHGDPNRRRRRTELLGPATVSSGFAMATPALSFRSPVPAPVLSASGATMTAAAARSTSDMSTHRTVTVNVGTITNAVPETAGDSLYRQVRKAVDGDER